MIGLSRTLHDQAYHALYHAILEGDLEPASRIIEAEISAALGISRGPVREAIRRLEAEGLLVTRAAVPSAPPAPGGAGQLVAAMAAPAATLDPTLNTATSSTEMSLHVFDSLVTYDDHFHIVPDLATRWSVSKVGLVYTFQLAHN